MVEVNWKLIIMREKCFKRLLKDDDSSMTYGSDNRKLIVESNVFALTIILFYQTALI